MNSDTKPNIAVLLASYNGAAFIRQQIESIANQRAADICLFVSDDGSNDATPAIVGSYLNDKRFSAVEFWKGPQKGFAENFRSIIAKVGANFDFYAFSDQDDEWMLEKFDRAFEKLTAIDSDVPAIYCGRTEIIDQKGVSKGKSPLFTRPPSFRNAIVQSLAGANTMVLNNAAMRLIKTASERSDFVVHDWFCYFVVSGSGGKIIYDSTPTVRYRQHDANIIGSNNSLSAKFTRLSMLFSGRFAEWNTQNLKTLDAINDLLTEESKTVVNDFKIVRDASLIRRVLTLYKSGIFRQSNVGTISLFVACLFRKL